MVKIYYICLSSTGVIHQPLRPGAILDVLYFIGMFKESSFSQQTDKHFLMPQEFCITYPDVIYIDMNDTLSHKIPSCWE